MDGESKVFVAAFGKHPGWNDHITDMGADTEPLVRLKRSLYVNGIGGNIDAGSWEKLKDDQRLPGFAHVFLHCEGRLAIVGRMWASQDGKGRARYPMVVAVQCGSGLLPAWLDGVLPKLETIETRCRGASTAAEVKEIMGGLDSQLQRLAAALGSFPASNPGWMGSSQALADIVTEGGHDTSNVFYRFFYRVRQTQDGPLVPKGRPGREFRASHFRVGAGGDMIRDLALWTALMRELAGTAVPVWLVHPPDAGWLDILLGPPGVPQIYCLLASRQAIPLTTTVPYDIEPAIREEADRWLARWRRGDADLRALLTMDGREDSLRLSGAGLWGLFRRARSFARPT